jgi:hypothetical protein
MVGRRIVQSQRGPHPVLPCPGITTLRNNSILTNGVSFGRFQSMIGRYAAERRERYYELPTLQNGIVRGKFLHGCLLLI